MTLDQKMRLFAILKEVERLNTGLSQDNYPLFSELKKRNDEALQIMSDDTEVRQKVIEQIERVAKIEAGDARECQHCGQILYPDVKLLDEDGNGTGFPEHCPACCNPLDEEPEKVKVPDNTNKTAVASATSGGNTKAESSTVTSEDGGSNESKEEKGKEASAPEESGQSALDKLKPKK